MYAYPEDRLHPAIVFTLWPFVVETTASLKNRKAFKYGSFNATRALERFYLPETLERICEVMPRAKRKQDATDGRGERATITWINIPLEADDELHIATTWEHDETCLVDLVNLLGQGWSFSIKPDDRTDGYVCFATGDYVSGNGKGLGVAGRASQPLDALRVALFRVAVLVTGQYAAPPPDTQRRFR